MDFPFYFRVITITGMFEAMQHCHQSVWTGLTVKVDIIPRRDFPWG